MKKTSIFITTLFCTLLFFSSCEEDRDELIVSESEPVVLSELAISDIELDPVNVTNPAATFVWTTADYGQQTTINYRIEFSIDQAFTNPVVGGLVSSVNSVTLTVAELNTAVGNAGLSPFEWNIIYARVVTSVGTQQVLPVASNVISFNVYPFFNYVFKDYYLVGDSTQPGWNNNNNNPPLFRDSSNSKLYSYVGYFGAGQFKVLEEKGAWQPQWGTNNGTEIAVNPGGGADPGTFPLNNNPIATAGYYTFTINFQTNTFSFVPYTESTSTVYTSMTVQGSATNSFTMTQSSFDNHIWYANNKSLVPGNLQFKTNTDTVWAGSTSFSGIATLNGGNIPVVVEDFYDIWYNDLTGQYIMIPLNL